MEVEKLYEMLKKAQEPKGYYFNKDKECVFVRETKNMTGISCARVYIGSLMLKNTVAATAPFMFQKNGTKIKSLTNMSLSGDHLKR